MFHTALQQLRKKTRLTQDQLADAIGVQCRTYGSWERGEREPDFVTLCKIADYFGVSTDYLLGRTDTPVIVKTEAPPALPEGMKAVELIQDQVPESPDITDVIRSMIADELKNRGL